MGAIDGTGSKIARINEDKLRRMGRIMRNGCEFPFRCR
jgi:hypothetical protein